MNKKLYDFLKLMTAVVPAVGAFYFAIAEIWHLPFGDAIVATASALTAFLSAILQLDSKTYFSGKNIVDKGG